MRQAGRVGVGCSVSGVEIGEFDAVITYGGPLSDVFDGRAADALTGLLRITRPGQPVPASVMSLLGTWRHFLPSVVAGAEGLRGPTPHTPTPRPRSPRPPPTTRSRPVDPNRPVPTPPESSPQPAAARHGPATGHNTTRTAVMRNYPPN